MSNYLRSCPRRTVFLGLPLTTGFAPSTSTATNLELSTNDDDGDEFLTVKLEAFSKNEKKKNETSKTITVHAATGDVMFWNCNSCSGVIPISVVLNVDGVNITRTINDSQATTPSCGTSDCANFNGLDVGTYVYGASDGTVSWSGTVEVTKNTCNKLKK